MRKCFCDICGKEIQNNMYYSEIVLIEKRNYYSVWPKTEFTDSIREICSSCDDEISRNIHNSIVKFVRLTKDSVSLYSSGMMNNEGKLSPLYTKEEIDKEGVNNG